MSKDSTYTLKYLQKDDRIELVRMNNEVRLIKPSNIKLLKKNDKNKKVMYYDEESGAKF